jgi:anthranilate phosphoribosyltransferase
MDGTDEVSISGETRVSVLDGGEVRTFRFSPEDAGVSRASLADISGGLPEENAAHVRDMFDGATGPRRDAVLLNAAFVAVLSDRAENAAEGVRMARRAIESGAARELLDHLCRASHSIATEAA